MPPYRFPTPDRMLGGFTGDELLRVAAANGWQVKRSALADIRRRWRFIDGPRAGGSTGKGRGKGQTWPASAAWRVAWLAYWRHQGLTIDALRLAMWIWTSALERERPEDLLTSAAAFLRQDDRFSLAVIARQSGAEAEMLEVYRQVVLVGDNEQADQLFDALPIPNEHPHREHARAFLHRLNVPDMQDSISGRSALPLALLPLVVNGVRRWPPDVQAILLTEFWTNPLALARLMVMEIHHTNLVRLGSMKPWSDADNQAITRAAHSRLGRGTGGGSSS